MLSPYSVISTGYTHQSVPLCCLLIRCQHGLHTSVSTSMLSPYSATHISQHGLFTSVSTSMLSPYSIVSTGYQSVPLCCLLIVVSTGYTHQSVPLCCLLIVLSARASQSVPLCCLLIVLSARAIHISQYLYVVSL